MDYLTVAEARALPGLRLALSIETPGPWGIAARALFDIRQVPFAPVRQELMQANADLLAWTGRRNAPVAVYADEPAVDGWLDIALLAERLGSGPSLFPDDPLDRALAVGFSAEICGAGGFGWARRLSMVSGAPPRPGAQADALRTIYRGYGMSQEAVEAAPARVIGILHALSRKLHSQATLGSHYLVGDRLSLCDVHWACFSQMIAPLPPEHCPLDERLRTMFETMPPEQRAAIDPILIEHRDRIWQDHIGLPLDF